MSEPARPWSLTPKQAIALQKVLRDQVILIDIETAVALVLRCDGGYRQPEPTRRAHLLVNEMRRAAAAP